MGRVVVRDSVVRRGRLWYERTLNGRGGNAAVCGGARGKGAGAHGQRMKDNMGMKKPDQSGSKHGGGRDGRNRRTAAQRRTQQEMTQCSQAWSDLPNEDIMVFASPPWKAGRTYCNDYRFLGLLPAPVKGWSDITRLYFKKFGVPPPNTRIFIRTWQVVDGWEDRGQMQLTNALVPTR